MEKEMTEKFRNYMIDELRYGPETVKATLRKMEYVFSRASIEPVTAKRESFQEYIREVWEKKGNKTANGYVKIINRWLTFRGLEPLKYFREFGTQFVIRYCSPEETSLLLQTAKKIGKREYAMFSLLFGTGVRLAEACNLKIQDMEGQIVRVKGKGQKTREIYIPEETRDAIRIYMDDRTRPSYREDQDYLFTTRAGNKMTYDFFRKITNDVGLAAGIKFHPHMARHTYATTLLRKGVSVVHVSQLLGHEDLSSTSVYLHPTQAEAIEEARKAIEGRTKGGMQGAVPSGTVPYGPVGSFTFKPTEDLTDGLLILFFLEKEDVEVKENEELYA